jgi:ribose transport system ATP-binding protein
MSGSHELSQPDGRVQRASGQPLVELTDIHKRFGGVHALRGVSLTVPRATVIGLAGENGAGKSTLLKVLSGLYVPDQGDVVIDGQPQRDYSPATARAAGIATVTQELSLVDHLSVSENVMLMQEPRNRLGLIRRKVVRERCLAALAQLGATISPDAMIRDLSFADRQLVEIAKALVQDPRLLVLDEPTSGLRDAEVGRLLETVAELRRSGRSIIFITHRMSEMFEVCDSFTVLKDGRSVGSVPRADATPSAIISMMVGRDIASLFPEKTATTPGASALRVHGFGVTGTAVTGIDLDVRAGEVVGLAGLAGNGQNELLEGLAGLRRSVGEQLVGTRRGPFRDPAAAIAAGVALIPEDRKTQGLVLELSVRANVGLPTIRRRAHAGIVDRRAEQALAESTVTSLSVRPGDPDVAAGGLSGGNQQKVVLGKWLAADPSVYLCSDPTRGIDVGTKQEIYELLRRLAAQGSAVVLLSTDLTELVGVCDRVLVMSGGRIVAELAGAEITEENITAASFGEEVMAS